MPKISESEVQRLRDEGKFLGKCLNERFERIGITSRESIWSIYSKWRGWFYNTLSIFGIAASLSTLCEKESESFWSWNTLFDLFKVETFNEIGIGIFSSVAVVWFGFQVMIG